LERLLPFCDNNPFKVADWLNNHHRWGDICLLGDGKKIARNSIPGILAVEARILDGKHPELYVDPRGAVGWNRRYEVWQFERDSFEKAIARFKPAPVTEPHGWQANVVIDWLRKTYPKFGKTPRRKTYKALRADMSKDSDVIAETERTGRAIPSEDVIGKVVKALGRSD
jgi:hypothetical protein